MKTYILILLYLTTQIYAEQLFGNCTTCSAGTYSGCVNSDYCMFGNLFQVTHSLGIEITTLGRLQHSSGAGLTLPIQIWSNGKGVTPNVLIAEVAVPQPQGSGYNFVSISPVTLPLGDYLILAEEGIGLSGPFTRPGWVFDLPSNSEIIYSRSVMKNGLSKATLAGVIDITVGSVPACSSNDFCGVGPNFQYNLVQPSPTSPPTSSPTTTTSSTTTTTTTSITSTTSSVTSMTTSTTTSTITSITSSVTSTTTFTTASTSSITSTSTTTSTITSTTSSITSTSISSITSSTISVNTLPTFSGIPTSLTTTVHSTSQPPTSLQKLRIVLLIAVPIIFVGTIVILLLVRRKRKPDKDIPLEPLSPENIEEGNSHYGKVPKIVDTPVGDESPYNNISSVFDVPPDVPSMDDSIYNNIPDVFDGDGNDENPYNTIPAMSDGFTYGNLPSTHSGLEYSDMSTANMVDDLARDLQNS